MDISGGEFVGALAPHFWVSLNALQSLHLGAPPESPTLEDAGKSIRPFTFQYANGFTISPAVLSQFLEPLSETTPEKKPSYCSQLSHIYLTRVYLTEELIRTLHRCLMFRGSLPPSSEAPADFLDLYGEGVAAKGYSPPDIHLRISTRGCTTAFGAGSKAACSCGGDDDLHTRPDMMPPFPDLDMVTGREFVLTVASLSNKLQDSESSLDDDDDSEDDFDKGDEERYEDAGEDKKTYLGDGGDKDDEDEDSDDCMCTWCVYGDESYSRWGAELQENSDDEEEDMDSGSDDVAPAIFSSFHW